MTTLHKPQKSSQTLPKKIPKTFHCVALTSFGKTSGGGHLERVKKLANLLTLHLSNTTPKSSVKSSPKKIHFTFLNSENLPKKHNKPNKPSWQNLKTFKHIVQKSRFIIIDSYEVKKKHFKMLLKKSSKQCSILLVDDGVKFLDFVLEVFATKSMHDNCKNFASALKRITILNGGLGSENCLSEAKSKIFASNLSQLNSDLLRIFFKNNVFYGGQYFVANNDFIYKRAKQRTRIKHILLTFGASDCLNLSQQATNALNEIFQNLRKDLEHIFEPSVRLHIVLGKFYSHKFKPKSNQNLTKNQTAISPTKLSYKIHKNLKSQDFALLMSKCDIAISASGQSLYEIALNTLPFITIPTANNQLAQAKAFAKSGGGIMLDSVDFGLDFENLGNQGGSLEDFTSKLENALRKNLCYFTQQNRRTMSQHLGGLKIGKSTHKIVARFLQNGT